MPKRESCDDRNDLAYPAERNNEAQQKQEVIHTIEDVLDPEEHKTTTCLIPRRIECHPAGSAREQKRPT